MGKNPAQKAKAAEAKAKDAKKPETGKVEKKAKAPAKKTIVAKGAGEEKCKIASCKRTYRAKGYCVAHYRKWRQGEYGKTRYHACSDIGCNKPMGKNRHGFCEDHFQNYYVKGMEVTKIPAPAPEAKSEAKPEAKADKEAASA